jgi:hypothetical protein
MFDKKDQQALSNVYTAIIENSAIPGKPVIVTMDMPGAMPVAHDDDSSHEERDPGEITMALSELHKIAEYAPKLTELISNLPSMEGWVASKITKAADYISSVYHFLDYESHSQCGSTPSMFDKGYEDSHDCGCGQCPFCGK